MYWRNIKYSNKYALNDVKNGNKYSISINYVLNTVFSMY